MRRTKEDAELTRKAILASAMDLLYEKGYSKTTFDEIAKRINLTKGAVYWYFRNKPDIVAALISDFANNHLRLMRQFISSEGDVSFDDLIKMELFNIRCIKEKSSVYKFVFFITCQMEWSEALITKIHSQVEETRNKFNELYINVLERMKKNKLIKQNTNIQVIYELIESVNLGLTHRYLTKRMDVDYEELIKTSYSLIFNSIKEEGLNQ